MSQAGIRPWISIRMNDVHDAEDLKAPTASRFWVKHPEYWRFPNRFLAWNDRCLNYGAKPVRDNMMALIREVCDRYDMDGLELDWNRFPLSFREGEEIEGGKQLTEWMAEVREVIRAAEKKWGHPIWLVPRVPARPEVSIGTGLDVVTWAKRGLIDHLIVSAFWNTTDFDIPVERWNELLKGTGVGVTAGMETRIQSHRNGPTFPATPERRRGQAMGMLARGSQGVYLFNQYDIGGKLPYLFHELHSIDAMADKDRGYVVTFVDINIPGNSLPEPLPKKLEPGQSAEFRLFIGPKPLASVRGEVLLALTPAKEGEKCEASVTLNGHAPKPPGFTYAVEAFREGYNTIVVSNIGRSTMTVEGVEMALRFPTHAEGVTELSPGLPRSRYPGSAMRRTPQTPKGFRTVAAHGATPSGLLRVGQQCHPG